MKAHPSDRDNLFPSTAHIDKRGNYVHDPLNQLLAEQEKQGKLGPQSNGQFQHIAAISGYCEHKVLGGCSRD